MKKFVFVVSVLLAALVAVVACGAPPRPLASAARDAGAPRRLGLLLSDAGLPVDEAGAVSIPIATAVPATLGDPAIDHCVLASVSIDPPTCAFAAYVNCGPRAKRVDGQLSAAQCGAVYNLVKSAAAAGGIQ